MAIFNMIGGGGGGSHKCVTVQASSRNSSTLRFNLAGYGVTERSDILGFTITLSATVNASSLAVTAPIIGGYCDTSSGDMVYTYAYGMPDYIILYYETASVSVNSSGALVISKGQNGNFTTDSTLRYWGTFIIKS